MLQKLEKTDLPQHTNHAVFQLTAALRNLVSEDLNYETFLSSGAVQELCHTMELFVSDSEIVGNISRILRYCIEELFLLNMIKPFSVRPQ